MPFPYLTDRRSLSDAEELIARHGAGAGHEAATRASRSRGLGNHIHFCRWRQIERLIAVLGEAEPTGRVH
jgi:hypothetical protein